MLESHSIQKHACHIFPKIWSQPPMMMKASEVDKTKEQVEYLMSTMMLSFPFLMKRLLWSSGGGPCFYLSDPTLDTTMMNTIVLSCIIPNVWKQLPESACLVLCKAFLWLICSLVTDEYSSTFRVNLNLKFFWNGNMLIGLMLILNWIQSISRWC